MQTSSYYNSTREEVSLGHKDLATVTEIWLEGAPCQIAVFKGFGGSSGLLKVIIAERC